MPGVDGEVAPLHGPRPPQGIPGSRSTCTDARRGMSCSPFDLRDYLFGELPTGDRRTMDLHLADCTRCREELDSLDMTQRVLMSVREEEPPRRIAFVSDKVFEPTWWQRLWSSGRVGFASAALLSMAIVAHGYVSRPIVTQHVAPPAQFDQAKFER